MRGWRLAALALLAVLVAAPAAGAAGAAGAAAGAGQVTTGLSIASPTLGRPIPYSLYVPTGQGPWPVLHLLHGLGGNDGDWLGPGGLAATLDREIAAGRVAPLAVVLPMGGDSWYVDDPAGAGAIHRAFATDLVDGVERRHGIGGCRAMRAAGGLSMGGYGAMLLAFERPDLYAAAISLSGSLFRELPADPAARAARNVRMFRTVFGDPFDWERYNRWNLFLKVPVLARAQRPPQLWLQAGDDDFPSILEGTVQLHLALRRAGIASELRVDDGGHDWSTWARDIVPALRWLSPRLARNCTG